jgi:hypothetical protein
MEVYAHDPLLASRLLVMAHWRLTPEQLKVLSPDEIAVMDFSHRVYERRWSEILTDIIGLLLGTSWSVNDLDTEHAPIPETPYEKRLRWALRDKPDRISIPLSFVIGGEPFVKHIKKLVSHKKLQGRTNPAILNHPGREWTGNYEIVELSNVPKEQFLKVASRMK